MPWSPEQKAAFLRQQFAAQEAQYRAHYPGAEFLVVELGGQPAGRLSRQCTASEHRLMDIALLPEFQGQGLGTRLLGEVLDSAGRAGLPVRLHVEAGNPALRLYERLGFRRGKEQGVSLFMEWRPPPVS